MWLFYVYFILIFYKLCPTNNKTNFTLLSPPIFPSCHKSNHFYLFSLNILVITSMFLNNRFVCHLVIVLAPGVRHLSIDLTLLRKIYYLSVPISNTQTYTYMPSHALNFDFLLSSYELLFSLKLIILVFVFLMLCILTSSTFKFFISCLHVLLICLGIESILSSCPPPPLWKSSSPGTCHSRIPTHHYLGHSVYFCLAFLIFAIFLFFPLSQPLIVVFLTINILKDFGF